MATAELKSQKKNPESQKSNTYKAVDGEERKTPTRILEEPAQPSFLPSVNSYRLFLLQVMGTGARPCALLRIPLCHQKLRFGPR